MDEEAPKHRSQVSEDDLARFGEKKLFEKLPTGKPHLSFSEKRDWGACSYRHKLKYIDKINLSKPSVHMDFGTAVHAALEDYVRTRCMKPEIATDMISSFWEKNKLIQSFDEEGSAERFIAEARAILSDVPAWFDATFPGWEFIDAEHMLYEPIEGRPHAFKGFIDAIIRCKGARNKPVIWLLDHKTCGWGWDTRKKSDPDVCAQLVLYKNYWCQKTSTPIKDVRCGFVLLKRAAKEGKHCELVTTSVGEQTVKKHLKVVNNMIFSVKRGIALKNRSSCNFCDYYNTEHCT